LFKHNCSLCRSILLLLQLKQCLWFALRQKHAYSIYTEANKSTCRNMYPLRFLDQETKILLTLCSLTVLELFNKGEIIRSLLLPLLVQFYQWDCYDLNRHARATYLNSIPYPLTIDNLKGKSTEALYSYNFILLKLLWMPSRLDVISVVVWMRCSKFVHSFYSVHL